MVIASIAVLSLMQALFNKSRQHELGIMLAVGVSKAEILLQRFMEAVFVAAAALVLSACASFLILGLIGRIISEIRPIGAVSTIAMFAVTAGCGMSVLLLATALSSLGAMRLDPKEILSKSS